MYTKDGVLLKAIADREDWCWSVKTKPKGKHIVCGLVLAMSAEFGC